MKSKPPISMRNVHKCPVNISKSVTETSLPVFCQPGERERRMACHSCSNPQPERLDCTARKCGQRTLSTASRCKNQECC
jgi:hypothetical protein